MKLVRTHALLAGAEKMERQQPFAEGDMAVCEDRANGHSELLAAPGTLPHSGANMLVLFGLFGS